MLSDAEFDAGEKLRADFWFAQMTPRVTANWSMLSAVAEAHRTWSRCAAIAARDPRACQPLAPTSPAS